MFPEYSLERNTAFKRKAWSSVNPAITRPLFCTDPLIHCWTITGMFQLRSPVGNCKPGMVTVSSGVSRQSAPAKSRVLSTPASSWFCAPYTPHECVESQLFQVTWVGFHGFKTRRAPKWAWFVLPFVPEYQFKVRTAEKTFTHVGKLDTLNFNRILCCQVLSV